MSRSLTDTEIADLFRAWWAESYQVRPGSHALMTHTAWARQLLEQAGGQQQPAPPPAGEVGELVDWLRLNADECVKDGCPNSADHFTRAADLLERQAASVPILPDDAQVIEPAKHTILVPAPVPVLVAERPWEREGWCDEQGRCWFCNAYSMGRWSYETPPDPGQDWGLLSTLTHALPHGAIPRPLPLPDQAR